MNAAPRRVTMLLASLAFCAAPHLAAGAQDPVTLRIGTVSSDILAEAYYAEAEGLFAQEGIRPAISVYSNGSAVASALASGAIDVGSSNVTQPVVAISRGAPFVLLAGAGIYSRRSPSVGLLVPKQSPLRKPQDLAGRTVAVTGTADLTQIALSNWLAQSGVEPAGVHSLVLPFTDMQPALQSGLADAAMVGEPWLSAALRSGAVRLLAKPYDTVADQFYIGLWMTTASWYAKNPGPAQRFVAAIYHAARWANGHHARSAEILARYSHVDVVSIRSGVRIPYATRPDAALLQPPVDLAYKFHVIDRPIDPATLLPK